MGAGGTVNTGIGGAPSMAPVGGAGIDNIGFGGGGNRGAAQVWARGAVWGGPSGGFATSGQPDTAYQGARGFLGPGGGGGGGSVNGNPTQGQAGGSSGPWTAAKPVADPSRLGGGGAGGVGTTGADGTGGANGDGFTLGAGGGGGTYNTGGTGGKGASGGYPGGGGGGGGSSATTGGAGGSGGGSQVRVTEWGPPASDAWMPLQQRQQLRTLLCM
jgi:hypothetical protein